MTLPKRQNILKNCAKRTLIFWSLWLRHGISIPLEASQPGVTGVLNDARKTQQTCFFPESIAKGSSGKSFEHSHFDTYTHTHTLEERKHPTAKHASVKACKCKCASMMCKGECAMICKGEYTSMQ